MILKFSGINFRLWDPNKPHFARIIKFAIALTHHQLVEPNTYKLLGLIPIAARYHTCFSTSLIPFTSDCLWAYLLTDLKGMQTGMEGEFCVLAINSLVLSMSHPRDYSRRLEI